MPHLAPPDDDAAWASFKSHWQFRPGTTYLNHGSFGPPPDAVRAARRKWIDALDAQPMDFFVRQLEPAWLAARDTLAAFVGASSSDLIFAENATVGMNIVADSFPLAAGDEVLLTDHEYGAVQRIWQRACAKAGAIAKTVELPLPFRTAGETCDAIVAAVTDRTKLVVVSHITSPTAVILPVAEVCHRAREHGIAVAIDGPHAIAQVPLDINAIGCDFYTASCHKWLCAPFGSGFLRVAAQWQQHVRPPVLSWGRIPPTKIDSWSDEFVWSGTRDPSAYLSIPAAIEFLESVGLEAFRSRTHWLAQYVRRKLVELTADLGSRHAPRDDAITRSVMATIEPLVPDDPAWYGSMAHVPLPPPRESTSGNSRDESCPVSNPLQHTIWRQLGIEVPIVDFRGQRYIRVSCHLYNDTEQIDRLVAGLGELLRRGE